MEKRMMPKAFKYIYLFLVGLLAVAVFDGMNIDQEYFGTDFHWYHYIIISIASIFGLHFINRPKETKEDNPQSDIEDFLNKK